ncbi:hypothetical protein ZOSMA_131G00090 [Zostera marina]|uniref:Uncharacterized protein n=1 Tax=Zostera marina TaxID=29655 RepID=A0A0K9Q1G9_ZOSMR|nr:hypothetical protein ZOSMA_131G00090 [Zostera marina]
MLVFRGRTNQVHIVVYLNNIYQGF